MIDLTELRIGAGGWSYFNIPHRDRLHAYSRVFDFVEVNSTFYRYPSSEIVMSWRNRASTSFEFGVRCHRDLTHRYLLDPREESYQVLKKMLSICGLLRAETLILVTPATMEFTSSRLDAIESFLHSADTGNVQFVWEIRRPSTLDYDPRLLRLVKDAGIVHCVDISKHETPMTKSDLLYTRLFGLGIQNVYQYTDAELTNIHKVATDSGFRKAVLSFHGTRMYKDASRLKFFEQTGQFPRVTESIGLESLGEVLAEDVRLPATKRELLMQQGWKVVDITARRRVKASELLRQLVEGTYSSIEQILDTLGRAGSLKNLPTA